MSKGFQGAVLRGLGAKEHRLRVRGKRYLTDNLLRVECHSDTLLNPNGEAPASWVRAWFPDPEGKARQFQRGYTLVEPDVATGTFAIDFVIHQPTGPAAHWALTCKEGDEIAVMRYGEHPFDMPDPAPAGCLLLGDLASFPAIRALAKAIPEEVPVVIFLEQHTDADAQVDLPQGQNISAAWVDELPDGQALVQALGSRDWSDWYAWVTAESTATRHVRTLLQRDHHLSRATLHAQAYWVKGRAMGKTQETEVTSTRGLEKADGTTAGSSTADTAAYVGGQTTPAAEPSGDRETRDRGAAARTPGVLAPTRWPLMMAGVAQGLVSILQIVPFVLFADVARIFLQGADRQRYEETATTAAVVMGLSALASALIVLVLHLYDVRFSADLRRRLTDKLTSLPLGWFRQRSSADVKKIVSDDVAALHGLVTHAVPDIVGAVVTVFATLAYLFAVQWRLALLILVPVVGYAVVMIGVQRRDAAKVQRSQREAARISGQMQEFITAREASALFGMNSVVDLPRSLKEAGNFIAEWQFDTGPRKIFAVMLNRPTTLLGLLVAGGYLLILPGWIAPSDLVPFLILGTAFGGQLLAVGLSAASLTAGMNARGGLDLFLATPVLQPTASREVRPGHVRFDDVTFSYIPERCVLDRFSLVLRPGEVTALVGASGAGKSTVAALLARLWDVDGGAISIDGRDIRDMTQEELYSHLGILLQDVQLIEATVAENIALAAPEASRERIEAAARAAYLHERIMAMPEGYDTVVTNSPLSGGERQRVGIARALLADAPIVVLDEATAAVDPEAEWEIQQSLDRLLAGRTVLMIAHRLHTVQHADQIVVMGEGRILESGSHGELMAKKGAYERMWAAYGTQGLVGARSGLGSWSAGAWPDTTRESV